MFIHENFTYLQSFFLVKPKTKNDTVEIYQIPVFSPALLKITGN